MNTVLVKRASALALLAATSTALTACAGVVGARMTFDDTEKTKVNEIMIDGGGSADVSVSTAPNATQTSVKRIIRTNGNPGPSYSMSAGTMTLPTDCGINCSITYEIIAPPGVAVSGRVGSGDISLTDVATADVTSDSGDITIKRATGEVKAHAESGDVAVHDSTGAVTVEVSSGDVKVLGSSGAVSARTESGDVEVKLAKPGTVTAKASSGDVKVIVPTGKYKVSADTSSGDKSIAAGVSQDDSSPNVLTLEASSGDLDVDSY